MTVQTAPATSITVQGSKGNTYNVYQSDKDGAWVCSCPAWKFQKTPGNARTCKHINKLFAGIAAHVAKSTK